MTPSTPTSPIRSEVAALRDRASAQVLVIGGGINGIATFRELALQGVDVVLVERGDYVSGASSASSHMVHGGIRYLENGEFRLVKEAVAERNGLLKIAPHYVRPLPTTMPIHSTFSGLLSAPLKFLTHKQGEPKERGALLIKIGMTIYDTFSRDGGTVPRHRFLGRKRALAELPALNKDFRYTATYFDASMHDPERLALDVLHDGLAQGDHARAVNHVEAVAAGSAPGAVLVRDTVSGAEFEIAADLVVNTSGPWTDLTNAALGVPSRFMGGTKGSHIVLDHPELLAATGGREIFFEHSDGRIVLIYPLKGRVMIGTTDIDADPRQPIVCTEEEIDYFFELVAHVFPDIAVDRSQIVYRFAGIRPLPRHDDTAPGFVSRDYRIEPGELNGAPMLSLVGGKWTTFRALGEHLSDEVMKRIGVSRRASTKTREIGGGRGFPRTDAARAAWVAEHAGTVSAERVEQLLERYGTRAAEVIEAIAAGTDAALEHVPGFSRLEVAHLVRTEQVVELLDLVLRRTDVAFVGDITAAGLDELVEVTGDVLGWSVAERDRQVAEAGVVLRERHGVRLDRTAPAGA